MKSAFVCGLLVSGVCALPVALPVALPIARAQQSLPPEKEPPVLVPLPAAPASATPAKPRLYAIPVRNQPASFLAWQLDPAHNPPPAGILAQLQLERDSKSDGSTSLLDSLAKPQQNIEMRVRWVQIDDENLPAWSRLGATKWTRRLSLEEDEAVTRLIAKGIIAPVTQQFYTADKKASIISYLPVRPTIAPSLRAIPPVKQRSAPDENSVFADPPYIPNLAEVAPMLPEVAPMPGAGGFNDLPFDSIQPSDVDPYLRAVPGGIEEMQGSRFQLTPTIEADKSLTLSLLGLDLPRTSLSVQVGEGETAAFSLPDILSVSEGKVRRTFLLVEARVVPIVISSPPAPQPPALPAPPAQTISPAQIPRLPAP